MFWADEVAKGAIDPEGRQLYTVTRCGNFNITAEQVQKDLRLLVLLRQQWQAERAVQTESGGDTKEVDDRLRSLETSPNAGPSVGAAAPWVAAQVDRASLATDASCGRGSRVRPCARRRR